MTATVPLLRGRPVRGAPPPRKPKPPWLRVQAPGSPGYRRLKQLVQSLKLHTVCE
ncbi:MAG: lipoyl synthase, partial [Acidobacteriota bacterium]|nr:lipoyl synthase [Acidobacteriota bacterium]